MTIAVLLSTYNGKNYLDAQLESLAQQTVAKDMTVYIRDDGSKDNTFQIIEKWKAQLSIQVMDGPNLGPAKSFWALLCNDQIQADYYAFCDQDDVWDPDKLETGIAALNADTHLYYCNCRLIDGDGRCVLEMNQTKPPVTTLPRLFVSGVVQGCAMVFTDALRRHIASLPLQSIPMHDLIFMLYALDFGGTVWDGTPRFSYRIHGNNVVAKNNKSLLQKLRTTWWNWKNSSKNSMSTVAEEMLKNASNLTEEDTTYLNWLRTYRKSPVSKFKLLFYRGTRCAYPAEKRSYIIRMLLNLL